MRAQTTRARPTGHICATWTRYCAEATTLRRTFDERCIPADHPIVVVDTPGTGAVFSIAAGLSRGTKAGIVAAFGCTLGVIPHMVAAITGLAAILNASAIAFQTIK